MPTKVDETDPAADVAEFSDVDRAPDASWFISFMDRANAQPEYARIRISLAEGLGDLTGRSVLDVGCGTGDDALELAALAGPGGSVTGVDLSEAMVEEARNRAEARGRKVEFRAGDVRKLDFPDGTFDAVRAKLVLMHCEGLDTAAAELVRVVRPGGRVAVFDYDFDTTTVDHPDKELTRRLIQFLTDGHPGGWSGRQLRRRFTGLGLTDVRTVAHTVVIPYEFFRATVGGRLQGAVEAGQLPISAGELAQWWLPLEEQARSDSFFTSLTGFMVAGTR
jgi:SAM-dependent methyltransferase